MHNYSFIALMHAPSGFHYYSVEFNNQTWHKLVRFGAKPPTHGGASRRKNTYMYWISTPYKFNATYKNSQKKDPPYYWLF